MSTSYLIQPTHLQRRAVIYVRQSSPSQVIKNQESARLQYALKRRALERGWHERDTMVIDADLGLTGSSAVDRPGFQELVALVSLGQVGIVFVYDPATPNGRLILGLKGLIAELELHTIRARLLAGTINKAERGELALSLPTGLVR